MRGILLLVLSLLWIAPVAAQNLPPAIQQELDRRSMSPEEARAMAQQLGINLNDPIQAAQRARELGVPETTIQEMLRAVRQQQATGVAAADSSGPGTRTVDPTLPGLEAPPVPPQTLQSTPAAQVDSPPSDDGLTYFGYDLFNNVPDAFSPTGVGAVDDAYVVGPGDKLRLTVWGAAEFALELDVDAQGRVFVPNVGQFLASGKRLSTLTSEMRNFLSRSYAGLSTNPPTVFMDLSVAALRPVQVYVLGEVAQPGGYTVAPNATGFNVLYATGGPLRRGSLRSIEIRRNGRRIGGLDLYSYLLKGSEDSPVRLQTNDFIFVPARGKTVAIDGAVRRPAHYELKGQEDLSTLLEFAGGLLPEAYGKQFQIERIVPLAERTDPSIAREVIDLSLVEVLAGSQSIALRDGDIVRIRSISDRLDNAVTVRGAVFQPGQYQLSADLLTLRDLIAAADGLTESAYRQQATLIRLDEEFNEELVTVNLSQVLSDNPLHNLPLRRRDALEVKDRSEVQVQGEVRVTGRVLNEGAQPFREGMTILDALHEAGGLQDSLFVKDVFLARADLFRRDGYRARHVIIPFDLGLTLAGGGMAEMPLIPGDELRVYGRQVENVDGTSVAINGAVKSPGLLSYREGMTVEDAILQAGGLTQFAFLESVRVSRPDPSDDLLAEVYVVPLLGLDRGPDGLVPEQAVREALGRRSFSLQPGDQVSVGSDPNYRPLETVQISGEVAFPGTFAIESNTETIGSIVRKAGGVLETGYLGGARLYRDGLQVAVDFHEALSTPRKDMRVLPEDLIEIPRRPNTIAVTGNVNRPALIRYERGKRVNYYLRRAGGAARNTEDIFVTQADGTTRVLRRGLFPSNPVVSEGGVIALTRKAEAETDDGADLGEVIAETISVISAALTAIVLASRL